MGAINNGPLATELGCTSKRFDFKFPSVKFSIVDLSAAAPAAEPSCTRRNQDRRIAVLRKPSAAGPCTRLRGPRAFRPAVNWCEGRVLLTQALRCRIRPT